MPPAVAFRGTASGAGGEASRSLPSLVPSKFQQRTDVGFLRLVEEASRPMPHSQLSIGNVEPFLLKSGPSSNSLSSDSSYDSVKDARDNLAFDWSRNVNNLRDAQRTTNRTPSRERRGDKSHSNSVTPEPRRTGARWRGDGIMTSTRVDTITGRDPLSELVVELNSRDSSPLTKTTPVRWPSVVSVHGRPVSGRRRNRRGSIGKEKTNNEISKFPYITSDEKNGRRVPPLPPNPDQTEDDGRNSAAAAGRVLQAPRTPSKSRRPRRPGVLTSPLATRSPRNSISRAGIEPLLRQRASNEILSPNFDFEESEDQGIKPWILPGQDRMKTTSEAGAVSADMGMGTMLSTYPRGLGDVGGPYGMVVSVGSSSDPVVGPVQAWSSHPDCQDPHLAQSQPNHPNDTRIYPWSISKTVQGIKVSWAVMMEMGVQTEAVTEEELDWDLSNKEDRETQTLPPNPTHFQLSRIDAFVQTDYRYFPLVTHVPRPSTTHLQVKTADKETQTEKTTTSVSTQTEAPYLMPLVATPAPPVSRLSEDGEEILQSDASSGPSTSGLGSALPRPQVLEVLPGSVIPSLPVSPPPSPKQPLSLPFDVREIGVRRAGERRWSRLEVLATGNVVPSELPLQTRVHRIRKILVDVSVQTDNDILTDEAPQFAARPPTSTKAELVARTDFTDLDVHVLTTPDEMTTDTTQLVRYLCKAAQDDLQRLRVLFRWVTENIRFDWKYLEKKQVVEEVLGSRAGVSKDYVNLLVELCHLAGFRVKKINGFARGRDFRIGRHFEPNNDPIHTWMAVFLYGSWRLLDPTWGAGYADAQGKFNPHPQEHYFLTDPGQMIHTHFPHHTTELQYHRWQLLETPLSLADFNSLPKVMPEFWSVGLRLNRPTISPVVFRHQTEVTLSAPTLVRYKYKFFPSDKSEEECINQWVFCTLKKGGVVGSFTILAPEQTEYILKVYAGREELLENDSSALDHVVSYLLVCEKPRRYPTPWPLHDVAWGPTPRLYECGIDPVNQAGPIIVTWGGKKLIYFEKAFDVMLMFQIFDIDGEMMEHKGVLGTQETEDQIRLVIVPPGIGFYKLLLYGIPRPQVRGRWRLPLLASYLIECKMSLGVPNKEPKSVEKSKKPRRRIKLARR